MNLAKMKVGQMRKELETRGLDVSGTRPVLMKRLREALAAESSRAPPAQLTHVPPADPPSPDAPPRDAQPEGAQPPPDLPRDAAQTGAVDQSRGAELQEQRQGDRAREQNAGKETGHPAEPRHEERDAPAQGAGDQAPENGSAAPKAAGSLAEASKTSMDERMRRRRERFGAVGPVKQSGKRADQTGKPEQSPGKRKRSPPSAEEKAELEEAKRRRRAKFGPVQEKPTKVGDVSAEEQERRLKRQRRFGAAAV